MENNLLTIGFDKNGDADFSASAMIGALTYEQMKEFREMTIVGIGIAEDIWRREQAKKNQPSKVIQDQKI